MMQRAKRCVTAHDIEPLHAALIILVLAVGALSTVTFRAVDTARTAQHALTRYQHDACSRGNVLRGYLIIRGELLGDAGGSSGAAARVFAITDCGGNKVVLPAAAQAAYLRSLAVKMGVQQDWQRVTGR